MRLSSLVVLVSLFSLPLPQSYPPGYLQGTHPDTSFRGISASRAGKSLVLWVTGSNNFIFRSLDFGKSSASAPAFLHIHKADGQDLRGVRSFSYDIAYVFSVGTENKSHIYKTTNAGRSWHIQYSDPRPAFFLDGLV